MFDNIILFTYLVEIGSFSKTAETVRLSQSTLSKRIIDLENSLNHRLFIRDTRNLELTEEGLLIYNKYKHLRNSLKKTIFEISGKVKKNEGLLSVYLPSVLSIKLITPFLNIYMNQNPDLELNIIYQVVPPNHELFNFDIALSAYSDTVREGFGSFLARQEFAGFYCTPTYASKYGIPITVAELSEHKIIGEINSYTEAAEQFIRLKNKYTNEETLFNNYKTNVKLDSALHMKELGSFGEFIFGCWAHLCEEDIKKGIVIPILPEYSIASTKFYLCHRSKLSAKEESFIEFIYQCLHRKIPLGVDSLYFM